MAAERNKKIAKIFIKILITFLAIYFVYHKIEVGKLLEIIKNVDKAWLFLAFIIFNLSKVLSAYRLNTFFKDINLIVYDKLNIQLYYVGMFYNLFLPGGIGGDGYKVYCLNKIYKTKVKDLILATLMDRVSGLIALLFLFVVLIVMLKINNALWMSVFSWIVLLSIYPIFWIIIKCFIARFRSSLLSTNIQSLGVQMLQLVCAIFILIALGVDQKYIEYQAVFLISSVVAVLPFTIGGIGARELVFVQSAQILNIEINTAVAFSMLFFVITAISSLVGIFFNTNFQDSAKTKSYENKIIGHKANNNLRS